MSGQGRRPELRAVIVTTYAKGGEEKKRWTTVGAAWSTRDGGYSIRFDAPVVVVPGISDLMLLPPREDKAATDFPPRQDEAPMEAQGEQQGYPEETP